MGLAPYVPLGGLSAPGASRGAPGAAGPGFRRSPAGLARGLGASSGTQGADVQLRVTTTGVVLLSHSRETEAPAGRKLLLGQGESQPFWAQSWVGADASACGSSGDASVCRDSLAGAPVGRGAGSGSHGGHVRSPRSSLGITDRAGHRLAAAERGSGQAWPGRGRGATRPVLPGGPRPLHPLGQAPAEGLGFPCVTTTTLDATPVLGSVTVPDTLSRGQVEGGRPHPTSSLQRSGGRSARPRSCARRPLRASQSLTLAARANVLRGNVVYRQSRAINYLMSHLPIS